MLAQCRACERARGMKKTAAPFSRRAAVWMPGQGLGAAGLFRLAAILAADFAFVLAALGAGLAFVGAAFLAGVTGETGGGEGGKGEDGEECFHDIGIR